MTEEERFKITSEDYADLIVEYNENRRAFDRFPNVVPHIINNRFAVIYIPVTEFTSRSIVTFGYVTIPSVYTITSERSLEASGIEKLRRLPRLNLRGQGVLIGIIDTGIDYTNPVFLHPDGTTKIMAIWDQTIESDRYPVPYNYGSQYLAEDINRALASPNPLEIVPSVDEIGHGTMLAGIAAGSEDTVNNFSGVVPDADLVVVKLKQAKQALRDFFVIPPDVVCYQETDLLWATQYLVEVARGLGRPISVCIGVGTSLGSHDGSGYLETQLSVGADFPGIVVSVAAGNEGSARRHFYSEVEPEIGSTLVELNVGENEPGFTMELWGAAPNTYSIAMVSPTGESIPRIPESLRLSRDISFLFETTLITIDYQMVETTSGAQLIMLRFRNPTPGIWNFTVFSRGDLRGSFHIWLPAGNFISTNTYFIRSNPYTTVTLPGNAVVPITVTAYNAQNNNLYQSSGKGYSRTNTIKPELAAPGVNILAPALDKSFTTMTGTSAAAAHMSGAAAILLEWGIIQRNYPSMDTVEVKKFMIRGANRNPGRLYPNRDWGYGILDMYNVFNVLRSDFQIL